MPAGFCGKCRIAVNGAFCPTCGGAVSSPPVPSASSPGSGPVEAPSTTEKSATLPSLTKGSPGGDTGPVPPAAPPSAPATSGTGEGPGVPALGPRLGAAWGRSSPRTRVLIATGTLTAVAVLLLGVPQALRGGVTTSSGSTANAVTANGPVASPTVTITEVAPVAPPSPTPTSTPQALYTEHHDSRYGFTVAVPKTMVMSPRRDGEGEVFTDGSVTVNVFGANLGAPLWATYESDLAGYYSGGWSLESSDNGGDVYTLSGSKDGIFIYQRTWTGPASQNTVYWTVPVAQRARFDAAIAASVNRFIPGDVTTAH